MRGFRQEISRRLGSGRAMRAHGFQERVCSLGAPQRLQGCADLRTETVQWVPTLPNARLWGSSPQPTLGMSPSARGLLTS